MGKDESGGFHPPKGKPSNANQSATELTSSSPQEIIPAAYYGRVSHIFIN